jgi:hypothetical protein
MRPPKFLLFLATAGSLACSFVSASLAGEVSLPRELAWPEIAAQTKPWSRWWWLGSVGTRQDYTTEMEKYAKAGLGGLEITPIYGVRGQEKLFRQYLSPEWMSLLDHVLDEGQRLGLGIDMSTGTGWPFGGPWVTKDFAARHVVTKTYTVRGGERLGETVTATDEPLVRVAGPRQVAISELKDPVTSNPNLQDLALDQVRFPRPLALQALVAHSEAGEKIDLTSKVGADGRLDWTAPSTAGGSQTRPAANWTLYAVFLGWHGKQVERAGPGGEGDVIDHFSSDALARYLRRFDEAYAGHRPQRLRGYFNDSYEVDDASGEANWTPRFFEEFQRRRGYDLRGELPAFFGKDTPEENARVMADHRETISDLLLEEFTKPWAAWAKKHGGLVRNQAHGSPANIIDLYAASDIPETEGNSLVGMKLASSAAHLTGRQLTSAETATWLDEHWVSTLGDIKRRVDQMFLGGVNHNCYHGTVFSPPGEPWPGHQFYASVELATASSIWADFDLLNAYVARAQSFLQAGKPANDILLYYAMHDIWSRRGTGAMPHISQSGVRGGGDNQNAPQELLNRGYTFDYVSDRLLAGVNFADGALESGGARYRAVVVSEAQLMPLATMEKLLALAEAGATVIFHKGPPTDVPGWGNLEARRAAYVRLLDPLPRATREINGVADLPVGRGRVLVGDALETILPRAGIARETLVDRGLQFVRRTHDDGHTYFLLNRGEVPLEGWVPLATPATSAAIFDPMAGRSGTAGTRRGVQGGAEVFVQLAPGESCIVKTFATRRVEGPAFEFWRVAGAGQPLAGRWSVAFTQGGPTLPAKRELAALGSWTELGDELKAFSGTAVYTTAFRAPAGNGNLLLDLGYVADSARVKLNGREIAGLISPPWRTTILREWLREGENTLEIAVTNLPANRVADLDRREPGWKKFYNINFPARIATNRGPDGNFSAAQWAPRPSGLLGPVMLVPAERASATR